MLKDNLNLISQAQTSQLDLNFTMIYLQRMPLNSYTEGGAQQQTSMLLITMLSNFFFFSSLQISCSYNVGCKQ